MHEFNLEEHFKQLKEEKQNVLAENQTVLEKSEDQKAIEKTSAYQELKEDVENTALTNNDVNADFTAENTYLSTASNNKLNEVSTQIDELSILEQEILDLENKIAETKKEKKKSVIRSELEAKQQKKAELEAELGDGFADADDAEYSFNLDKLKGLVETIKSKDNDVVKDVNYQKAKLLEQKYISNKEVAQKLFIEAREQDNPASKAEKYKEAHQYQLAAIDNQREAIDLLEEVATDGYELEIIGEEQENLTVDTTEEEEDMGDLELRLRRYQMYRDIAQDIETAFGKTLTHERQYTADKKPLFVTDQYTTLVGLEEAIGGVLVNLPRKEVKPKVQVKKVISLEEMMDRLHTRIETQMKLTLSELLEDNTERVHVIVGFLAVLESVKQGNILVAQAQRFDDIEIEQERTQLPHYR